MSRNCHGIASFPKILGNNTDIKSSIIYSLVVRNNDIHHYNTRQNHHLRGSRPTCKTVVNSFTNRSFQIWNAISSQININVSLYKLKYNVKLFLLQNDLMIIYHY